MSAYGAWRSHSRAGFAVSIAAAVFLFAPVRVSAQTILSASVSGNTLTITGANLGINRPTVQLGLNGTLTALAVVSFSPTTVVAAMPSGVAPATYELLFTRANGAAAPPFDLTVGAVGPPGPPGPAGPSTDAFVGPPNLNPIWIPAGGAEVIASTVVLPPGSYVISGKVVVGNTSDAVAGVDVVCFLANVGGTMDRADAYLSGGTFLLNKPGSIQTLPLQSSVTTSEPMTITLRCVSPATDAVAFAQFAQLTALRVGTLTTQ